jgi:hypothetical protein
MERIFYLAKDTTGKSQTAAALAKIKYPNATVTATDGKDNTAMAACISALTDNTLSDICICMPLVNSHAAGKFTCAQAILLIAKLLTARQGTNVTGTCASNATVTAIKLAASGPSTVDDFYNLRIIAIAGTTPIDGRVITDYVGSTKVCTVSTTTTAITTTETYIVYMTDYLHILGEALYNGSGTGTNVYQTWKNLFPLATQMPTIVWMLAGLGALYHKDSVTASGACGEATLTDTGEFTLNAYTGLDYWVILETATTGGGQIRKIVSNTADVLTVSPAWSPLPTGTPVYSIKEGANRLGWDLYLAKALPTYLLSGSAEDISKLTRMMDQYGDLAKGNKWGYEEESLIEFYAAKGKVICEAIWAGVVS